jgi:hypothetical protein
MESGNKRNESTRSSLKEDCKKIIWTSKTRRTVENKKKEEDKGLAKWKRYCKVYEILPTMLLWSS